MYMKLSSIVRTSKRARCHSTMMMRNKIAMRHIAAFCLISISVGQPFSIDDFGAVSGVDQYAQAVTNGAAFAKALVAANASSDSSPTGSTHSTRKHL